MIHVADSPKNRHIDLIFGAFYPHPAHGSSLRAEGAHPLSGAREAWLAPKVSPTTVLPPHATTSPPLTDPPKSGSFACWIRHYFDLSPNVPVINAQANWVCFGVFLSPPACFLRLH